MGSVLTSNDMPLPDTFDKALAKFAIACRFEDFPERKVAADAICNEARTYAAAAVAAERNKWVAVACDGFLVYQHLSEQAANRTHYDHVSDTLDALVRAIRGQDQKEQG